MPKQLKWILTGQFSVSVKVHGLFFKKQMRLSIHRVSLLEVNDLEREAKNQ
jgi:hypothetical protein